MNTPYGLTNRCEGSYNTDYRFTGKLFDSSSNLYYYGARYYDPELGRFTQADTIVQAPYDPQSLNRYSYCRNNPINYVDPTGHGWFKNFLGKIFGAVIGVAATILSGGNVALGFAAFNMADAIVSGGQALYYGANPAQVFGAVGLGIALNSAIPFPNFANLGLQIGAAAVRGAAISTATAAAIQGGKGKYGPVAAWGGGMGGTSGFLSSQQFQNWQGGSGFRSNRDVLFAEYEQQLEIIRELSVNQRDTTVKLISRPLSKGAGIPGSTTGPRHNAIISDTLSHGKWEMGPFGANDMIYTTNTVPNLSGWGTHITTEASLALGGRYAISFPVEVNAAGLHSAISLYETTFVGNVPYNALNHNSNNAVNTVIYGAGADVPIGHRSPGFPDSP